MNKSTKPKFPIVIGVVGGVASGKSTLTDLLRENGAKVITADKIGHEVLKEANIVRKLHDLFGNEIFKNDSLGKENDQNETNTEPIGVIDRKKLGELVFGETEPQRARRKQLESIVHPRIREIAKDQLELLRTEPNLKYIVLDAPLLIEGGWITYCNKVVFLETSASLRKDWAMARGWSQKEWEYREAAQLALDVKRSYATDILINAGTMSQLKIDVECMLDRWNN